MNEKLKGLLSNSLLSALVGALVASGVSAVLSYWSTTSLQLTAHQMETALSMLEVREFSNPDAIVFDEVTGLMKVAVFMPRDVLEKYHEVGKTSCFNEIREECVEPMIKMLNAYRDALGTESVDPAIMESIVRSMQTTLERLPSRQK